MGTESKTTLSNGFSVDHSSTGNQESYHEVVLLVSGGRVVDAVVVVVVIVVAGVVLRLACNLCKRSLRIRISRSRLRRAMS